MGQGGSREGQEEGRLEGQEGGKRAGQERRRGALRGRRGIGCGNDVARVKVSAAHGKGEHGLNLTGDLIYRFIDLYLD